MDKTLQKILEVLSKGFRRKIGKGMFDSFETEHGIPALKTEKEDKEESKEEDNPNLVAIVARSVKKSS